MTAAVWCKEHAPTKTIVHRMNDLLDQSGQNVLQVYAQRYKQADETQTGATRKANLINQSTKAVSPIASTVPSHRRTSSATNGSLAVRGSVSHIKVDEPVREPISVACNDEVEKTCSTCGIDVSPKWYPCPPAAVSWLPNGDHPHSIESVLPGGPASEGGAGNIALAAAALHQNGQSPISSKVQCHQCHKKKIRKEPTPSPAPHQQREEPRHPIPPPISSAPRAEAEVAPTVHTYGGSQPRPYPQPNGSYEWPRRSPAPQAVAPVHQLNGHHSPRVSAGPGSGQPQFRQPSQPAQLVQTGPPSVQQIQPIQPIQPAQQVSRSPHQSQMAQPINGYPPSPHRSISSSSHHAPYPSFRFPPPPPQHLTNGGPPPRAPEHPLSHSNAHSHPRPPYALPPHGSPPMQRDPHPQGREPGNQQNGSRPSDGRVNGGASASPSLRNLLS